MISIPEGVTIIGEGAFCHLGIEEIVLLSSLKKILARDFDGCYLLNKIIIPNNVESIEYAAFRGCEN